MFVVWDHKAPAGALSAVSCCPRVCSSAEQAPRTEWFRSRGCAPRFGAHSQRPHRFSRLRLASSGREFEVPGLFASPDNISPSHFRHRAVHYYFMCVFLNPIGFTCPAGRGTPAFWYSCPHSQEESPPLQGRHLSLSSAGGSQWLRVRSDDAPLLPQPVESPLGNYPCKCFKK